jgi:hypothetical protein
MAFPVPANLSLLCCCSPRIGWAARDTWSDTDDKIGELSEALHELKDQFDSGILIQSVFISANLLDKVEGLGELSSLHKLFYLFHELPFSAIGDP